MSEAIKYKIEAIELTQQVRGRILGCHTMSVTGVAAAGEYVCQNLIALPNLRYFEKETDFTIYITYPLTKVAKTLVTGVDNIGSLFWHMAMIYRQIYQEEEKAAKQPPNKKKRNPPLNREDSNGKYGIDLHDIGDLVFEGIVINKRNEVMPLMGS